MGYIFYFFFGVMMCFGLRLDVEYGDENYFYGDDGCCGDSDYSRDVEYDFFFYLNEGCVVWI